MATQPRETKKATRRSVGQRSGRARQFSSVLDETVDEEDETVDEKQQQREEREATTGGGLEQESAQGDADESASLTAASDAAALGFW